jgi:2-polyprenyl-3-methyl-5-hydroxy-6-metoxy-1,4-benzoquinol methylase
MPATAIGTRLDEAARAPAGLDAVRSYWDAHVDDWKAASSPSGTLPFFEETEAYRFEKLDYLARVVDFDGYAGRRLLDLGCGIGNDTARFARGGAEVTGIDLAPRAIELASRNFELRELPGRFAVMNGEALDFADASFDVVYCHTVLHFTPQPRRMIHEIHRVLRPGGAAILMVVNRRSWLRAMHRLAKVEIDHLAAPVFHWFTAEEFARLLAPFTTVAIVPERFPVPTKVHKGLKARLFNLLFVDGFNALPRVWMRRYGHHLMAFASKGGAPPDGAERRR